VIGINTLQIVDGDLIILNFGVDIDYISVKSTREQIEEWLKNRGLTACKVMTICAEKEDVGLSITKITANDPFETEVLKNGV